MRKKKCILKHAKNTNSLILYGQTSAKLLLSFNYGILKAAIISIFLRIWGNIISTTRNQQSLSTYICMFCQYWNWKLKHGHWLNMGNLQFVSSLNWAFSNIQIFCYLGIHFFEVETILLTSGYPGHSIFHVSPLPVAKTGIKVTPSI